jgi:hypothetical protein
MASKNIPTKFIETNPLNNGGVSYRLKQIKRNKQKNIAISLSSRMGGGAPSIIHQHNELKPV